MAHLTASPFRKPSPAEVSRPSQLPTPPETDTDFGLHQGGTSNLFGHPVPPEAEPAPFTVASVMDARRRVSTLSYHNTPLRDFRDRNPRQTRWLIVAIPPPSITKAHGSLGHTLGSGPADRISQGILMPLFPTLYGQLTAIAREFNFPSSVGLCLYLQVTDQGFTMMPRISDETWSVLWSHIFEARSPTPSPLQLPICGRVEFDIDLNKARWYDSWIASERRQGVDGPASVAPSVSHWRGDSKTSFHDEQLADDRSDVLQTPQSRSRPPLQLQRHVPRKLSLLDKFETSSVTSGLANVINASEELTTNALTPIQQEEEPKTAIVNLSNTDLENRVKSWRASSSHAPTPMAATGQSSLDPVNMPNTVPLLDLAAAPEANETDELNLDDFTWSVSSLSPGDYDSLASPVTASRVHSVHLDRRLEGSVLLSPTTATSWGPDWDDDASLTSPVSWSRVPSVHLDRRLEGSVLLSPTTATSWGPPDEDAISLASSISRLASPDIARRMMEDVPLTPLTATSWGPPSSYPPSPLLLARPRSVDIAHRMMFSPPVSPLAVAFEPVFPYYRPDSPSSPSDRSDVSELVFPYFTPGAQDSELAYPLLRTDEYAFPLGWPAVMQADDSQVFPHFELEERTALYAYPQPNLDAAAAAPVWPSDALVDQRGPRARAFKAEIRTAASSESRTSEYPFFDLYPALPSSVSIEVLETVQLTTSYPALNIYPVAYPYFEIYPGHVCVAQQYEEPRSVHLNAAYPSIGLYPAVYPNFEIYPGHLVVAWLHGESLSVQLTAQYPGIHLYPVIYPNFEIYPDHLIIAQHAVESISVHLEGAYPYLEIYASVYPFLAIYPAVAAATSDESALTVHSKSVSGRLPTSYPDLDIYPSVYPHIAPYPDVPISAARGLLSTVSTLEIYPAGKVFDDSDYYQSRSVRLSAAYPAFDLYPAVYPALEIYPATVSHSSALKQPVRLPTLYPHITIYSAVYPEFDIYPAVAASGHDDHGNNNHVHESLSIRSEVQYPAFNLYPAVYPHFDIYPFITLERIESHRVALSISLRPAYPVLSIFPAVYPHFEIYPGEVRNGENRAAWRSPPSQLEATYPRFDIYPAVYPYFDLYRSGFATKQENIQELLTIRLPALYPAFNIYPAVYPHFELWPSVHLEVVLSPRPVSPSTLQVSPTSRSPRRSLTPTKIASYRPKWSHEELHEAVIGPALPPADSDVKRRVTFELPAVESPAPPTPSPRSRARSGTVSARSTSRIVSHPPPPPTLVLEFSQQVPSRPPAPPHAPAPSQSPAEDTFAAPAPAPAPRRVGLPSHPAAMRNSYHARPASSFIPKLASLSPVDERSAATLQRSNSQPGHKQAFRPRDSIVLERAKFFDNTSSGDGPTRITMNALAEFPLPPMPPVPPLPGTARSPVTKLDRSKYPFA